MNEQAELNFAQLREVLARYDLLPQTRMRTEIAYQVAQASNESILNLLHGAGIQAQAHAELQTVRLGSLAEYYHHILQDWAWDDTVIAKKVQQALAVCDCDQADTILVLGSGAGRLSWELHNALEANTTFATDINPVLLLAGNQLIRKRQGFEFFELNSFPQIGFPDSQSHQLKPPADPRQKRDGWIPMAADMWRMPIKPQSMDLVVTSWLLDVHGGDNRDVIGLIKQWLKPGGLWLNTGPLLYPRHQPFDQKYDREELLALMELAGFSLSNERLDLDPHLVSPINARQQTEQVWSFCARALTESEASQAARNAAQTLPLATPAWLLLPHLPVPIMEFIPAEPHPMIDLVLALVDGHRSINDIVFAVIPQLPPEVNAKAAVISLFGELLETKYAPE